MTEGTPIPGEAMGITEGLTRPLELTPAKEKFRLIKRGFSVSGPIGTGKTAFARFVGKSLGIPDKVRYTGEEFKRLNTSDDRGYIIRPEEMDRRVDAEQVKIMLAATLENPAIIDGDIAGVIANFYSPDFPTVLLTAPTDWRIRRVQRREIEEGKPRRTLRAITKAAKSRARGDIERWKKVHPELDLDHPFASGLVNRNGERVYTIQISTVKAVVGKDGKKKMKDKSFEEMLRELIKRRIVRKI